MKILIICGNDIFSGILAYKLISQNHKSIVGILLTKKMIHKKSPFGLFKKVVKTSGLTYAFYLANELIIYKIIAFLHYILNFNKNDNASLCSISRLAKKYNIEISQTKDIMAEQSLKKIKTLKPDLIISIRLGQIIKKRLLQIPALGAINFHASLLPKYAGLGSVFQAVFYNEKYNGVTVHFMNEKIDQGKIIVQEKIKIIPNESISRLYLRCHIKGADLINKAVKLVESDNKGFIPDLKEKSYFSWPEKQKIKKFKKCGGKFLKISDIFYLLFNFKYEK